MLHFKNRELAEKYHVSPKTVSNWIDLAKSGKADLMLVQKGKYSYVADTQENDTVLKLLAAKGKKYRNTAYFKEVSPRPGFYDIYSDRQILDIITNLSVHGEVPLPSVRLACKRVNQYNYLQDGAKHWEDRMARFESESVTNSLAGTSTVASVKSRGRLPTLAL
ncbi:hypothetical protein [Streptomyces sp. GC420]|uniref:hypothetical protein n=1 Tax=Streptomyces sp. GC420 TaxID=2697568 RepID=UPI00141522E3|nr:hypothetical protein [Streptomyces sp. GC420]NBM14964.1 hypothetical protein [Streptomyces sp. GC420]